MKIKGKRGLSEKQIIDVISKHNDVLRKYRIKRIGLFGSYIRGEQKRKSDIDFLVEFDETTFDNDFTGYFDNYKGLAASLKKLLKKKIDLLTPDMISPYIKDYVLREVEYIETT